MTNRCQIRRRSFCCLPLLGASLLGCATTHALPTVTTLPRDEAHESELGTPLTQAAEDRWRSALAGYHAAHAQGFDAETCASVVRAFEEADAAQGGHFAEAVYMIGVTHERCGDAGRAHDFYARALQMDEHLCGARVAAGLEHYRAGRVEEARSEIARAVRDDPRCTEGYVNLAILQRRSPAETADALDNLRRALAIDASYLPALNQMALLYLEQAIRQPGGQGSSQMLDLAEVVCRQAQLVDADYAPIYNTWGLINVRQGNIIAALAKFERASSLDGSLFEAYMNFGELTLSFRGYDDATHAFTRATELRADSYDAYVGLGAAQRGLGHPDEAQAAYERAIEIDESRPEAYFNLGVLDQDFRDGGEATLGRALGHYRDFVSHAGSSPGFADAVLGVTRECTSICVAPPAGPRRHRRPVACSMGRIQQITESLCIQRQVGASGSRDAPADGATLSP